VYFVERSLVVPSGIQRQISVAAVTIQDKDIGCVLARLKFGCTLIRQSVDFVVLKSTLFRTPETLITKPQGGTGSVCLEQSLNLHRAGRSK
jgi:hypothetical protein